MFNSGATARALPRVLTASDGGWWSVVRFGSKSVTKVGVMVAVAAALAGCAPNNFGEPTGSLAETALVDGALPSTGKMIHEAQLQFTEGHYGLAVDAYAKSVERDPLNPEGWLGLAASYDQIGRFDLADKAYERVQELIGATPSVLNNLGYSYLLRGNLDRSRATLAAAYKLDPHNPYILNNIDMLNERLTELNQKPFVPG